MVLSAVGITGKGDVMNFDRKFLVCALLYAIAGMSLGIYMAATDNHGELVAHAHILLVGFVVSFIYGIIHKLWLAQPNSAVANLQFYIHQAAALILSVGLTLLYGRVVPAEKLVPALTGGSLAVLIGAVMMLYMVLTTRTVRS
jgi:putative solute:sodium symporter small subunit